MWVMLRRLSVWGFVCAMVGCAESERHGAGGGGSGPSVGDALDRVRRAACESIWACPLPDDGTIAPSQAGFKAIAQTVDGCVELLGRSFDPDRRDLEEKGDRGEVRVDLEDLEACERELRTCVHDRYTSSSACDGFLEGSLSEGAACSRTEECGEGLRCDTENGRCPGTCQAKSEEGGSCTVTKDCIQRPGTFVECGFVNEQGVCFVADIAQEAGEGEPCVGEVGQLVPCAEGLHCSNVEAGWLCLPPIPIGEPCGYSEVCAAPANCNGPTGATTCQVLSLLGDGDACGGAGQGSCDPFLDLECLEGTCQLTGGAEGSICPRYSSTFCADGLFCASGVETTGVCTRRKAPGEECQNDRDCASGLCACQGDCTGLTCAEDYCALQAATRL